MACKKAIRVIQESSARVPLVQHLESEQKMLGRVPFGRFNGDFQRPENSRAQLFRGIEGCGSVLSCHATNVQLPTGAKSRSGPPCEPEALEVYRPVFIVLALGFMTLA